MPRRPNSRWDSIPFDRPFTTAQLAAMLGLQPPTITAYLSSHRSIPPDIKIHRIGPKTVLFERVEGYVRP